MRKLLACFLIVLITSAKIEDDVVLERGFSFPRINIPRMPSMPRMPRMPSMPRMPRMPSIPKMPRMPSIPKMPRMP